MEQVVGVGPRRRLERASGTPGAWSRTQTVLAADRHGSGKQPLSRHTFSPRAFRPGTGGVVRARALQRFAVAGTCARNLCTHDASAASARRAEASKRTQRGCSSCGRSPTHRYRGLGDIVPFLRVRTRWMVGSELGPCLLIPKIQKLFKIPCHACMEY